MDKAGSSLRFGFGATDGAGAGRPAAAPTLTLRARARRFSAVPKLNRSCLVASSTGAAFPPRARGACVVVLVFRRAFGTSRRSDFCRAIASSFFRSPCYRAHARSPADLVGKITLTSRPSRRHYACTTDEDWASPLTAGSPDADALRRFTCVRYGRAPTTSTRRPLAGPRGTAPTTGSQR